MIYHKGPEVGLVAFKKLKKAAPETGGGLGFWELGLDPNIGGCS